MPLPICDDSLFVLQTIAAEHPEASSEYFALLCRLLNFGRLSELQLNNSEAILEQEISWLSAIWVSWFSLLLIISRLLFFCIIALCWYILFRTTYILFAH